MGFTTPLGAFDNDSAENAHELADFLIDNTRNIVGPKHSGAGRMVRIPMGTMTQQEMRLSTGAVSIRGLFKGESGKGISAKSIQVLIERRSGQRILRSSGVLRISASGYPSK